jgi:hypothetical protein
MKWVHQSSSERSYGIVDRVVSVSWDWFEAGRCDSGWEWASVDFERETDVWIRSRCLVVTETERVTRGDLFLRR